MKCLKCKDFTQTINPIIISKLIKNRSHIKAICSICNKFKSKFLNQEQIKLLPDEIQHAADNTTFSETIERNGRIIPLIPLIGAIAARISALASAEEATASAIISAKNSAEDERDQKAVEQIARGNGISNDVIKNYTDLQTPNNEKGITIDLKLAAAIIFMVPSAIEVLPSAVNKIKNLINSEENKVHEVIKINEPKQEPGLSEHELYLRAINRLMGRGFQIKL